MYVGTPPLPGLVNVGLNVTISPSHFDTENPVTDKDGVTFTVITIGDVEQPLASLIDTV